MTEAERRQHGISDEAYARLNPMKDHDLLIHAVAQIENIQTTCPAHDKRLERLEKCSMTQSAKTNWLLGFLYAAWGLLTIFITMVMKGEIKI